LLIHTQVIEKITGMYPNNSFNMTGNACWWATQDRLHARKDDSRPKKHMIV